MPPRDFQVIGTELAIKWEDGTESFVSLEKLRRACPCAGCQGEGDLMGRRHIPEQKPLQAGAFMLRGLARVGSYALQPQWQDGHATGLYTFEYLKKIAG